ncbi:hypothetical protein AAF712_009554 [Marasmius tenuissimus]|uniref:Extracellular metalloproteinase n=1 Tax=Marasmius tenuissimus TaxID=585030 RepID=A0ABR2ZQM6_9AGAR
MSRNSPINHLPLPTWGNNVAVYIGHQFQDPLNTTLQSSPGLVFNYTYDASQDPTVTSNQDAVRTNVFYLANTFHDTLYLYGFTESAFNFQNDNFGKGGVGGDRFLPQRDGAMENDLVIHELTHGMTSRMTGGGTAQCLDTREAGGLDEGWADAVANWFSHSATPEVHDFYFIPWVTNGNSTYFRTGPYSTSVATNSLRYSDLSTRETLHEMGEVKYSVVISANTGLTHFLFIFSIVVRYGRTSFTTSTQRSLPSTVGPRPLSPTLLVHLETSYGSTSSQTDWHSNRATPHLRLLEMPLSKLIRIRYGEVNRCLLWKVFASRGVGVEAKDYVDSDTVPEGC